MITAGGVFIVFIISLILILNIATGSIGMECYNKNSEFENSSSTRKSNKSYLKWITWGSVGSLVALGIVSVVIARMPPTDYNDEY
jgi:hypothetical protein